MTTAITQDLIDPFTPQIEELLRERDAALAAARPIAVLLCDLFLYLMRLMAAIFERKRAGELAAMAPAGAADQPEINEPVAEAVREMPPFEVRGVEQPTALPLPRRARGRKLKVSSVQAPARRRHVDHGVWPLWRRVGVFWTAEVGFLGVDSKKWVLAGGDSCVYVVTI